MNVLQVVNKILAPFHPYSFSNKIPLDSYWIPTKLQMKDWLVRYHFRFPPWTITYTSVFHFLRSGLSFNCSFNEKAMVNNVSQNNKAARLTIDQCTTTNNDEGMGNMWTKAQRGNADMKEDMTRRRRNKYVNMFNIYNSSLRFWANRTDICNRSKPWIRLNKSWIVKFNISVTACVTSASAHVPWYDILAIYLHYEWSVLLSMNLSGLFIVYITPLRTFIWYLGFPYNWWETTLRSNHLRHQHLILSSHIELIEIVIVFVWIISQSNSSRVKLNITWSKKLCLETKQWRFPFLFFIEKHWTTCTDLSSKITDTSRLFMLSSSL